MVLKPRSKMINNFIITCVQIKGVGRKRFWERYLHSALYSFRFYNGGLTHLKKMNKFLLFFGFVTLSIYLLSMENKNKNRKVIIRITESQLAKIVEETKRLKMNKSTLLREIIDSHIDQISSESIMEKYRVKKSKN